MPRGLGFFTLVASLDFAFSSEYIAAYNGLKALVQFGG
jgi:hypothetical protein